MQALTEPIQLQVKCPTCPESYTVPLSVVEEAQRLLHEVGTARDGGALAVRVGRQLRRAADAVALAFELARWENEGGAPADAE